MIAYLDHFRPHWKRLFAVVALLSLLGALPALGVFVLQGALDALLTGQPVGSWLALLIALAAVQAGGSVLRASVTRRMSWDLVHQLRTRLHRRFHVLPVDDAVGSRLAALSHEADELQYGVSALVTAVRAPVAIVALGFSAAVLAPELLLRFLVALPPIGIVAWLGGLWVRTATRRWREARAVLLQELTDQHNGLSTSQDLGATSLQVDRLERISSTEAHSRAHLEWIRTVPSAGVELAVVLAIAALLVFGQLEVTAGRTTPGSLVAFAVAVGLVRRPLVQLSEVWSLAQRSIEALARIERVLQAPVGLQLALPDDGVFAIDGGAPSRVTACLTIAAGEKLALAGDSGAGKSSLLAVFAGQLPIEGHLRRCRAQLLRQDPWVFDRTLRENLLLGAPDATEAQLHEVLRAVCFPEALLRLDEPTGERGCLLSGGERQRLCLARALLSQPRALLLDEVTSELDPITARAVAAHLAQLDATVVFAAHDPAFAELADRVAWFHDGALVDLAPHRVLLERHRAYARFWELAA